MTKATLFALSLAAASILAPTWVPTAVQAAEIEAAGRTVKIGVPDMH